MKLLETMNTADPVDTKNTHLRIKISALEHMQEIMKHKLVAMTYTAQTYNKGQMTTQQIDLEDVNGNVVDTLASFEELDSKYEEVLNVDGRGRYLPINADASTNIKANELVRKISDCGHKIRTLKDQI